MRKEVHFHEADVPTEPGGLCIDTARYAVSPRSGRYAALAAYRQVHRSRCGVRAYRTWPRRPRLL